MYVLAEARTAVGADDSESSVPALSYCTADDEDCSSVKMHFMYFDCKYMRGLEGREEGEGRGERGGERGKEAESRRGRGAGHTLSFGLLRHTFLINSTTMNCNTSPKLETWSSTVPKYSTAFSCAQLNSIIKALRLHDASAS